jgi:predicted RNA-binding Zn-ribbon protein involved in translation (DUF1610 family)
MTESGQCANCGASLSQDRPADSRYCASCAAAYWRGAAARKQLAPSEDEGTRTAPGQCANCGTPLPSDQPADSRYCAKCTAAWQRDPAARRSGP